MGTLFIVSTPIGNLKDVTLRAPETLKNVDYILCEDTRVTGKLLGEYGIEKRMVSFNDFSENSKTPGVIDNLLSGANIALVCDAGTPLISDPGYRLVRDAINKGIKVESIPGPSAVVAALVVSGKPPDKFFYLGYLPKKEGKRKNLLQSLSSTLLSLEESHLRPTIIFYESPYRLIATLLDISEIFGDIDIVVCRELTKIHEEVRREKVSSAISHFSKSPPRGEFTVLF